MTMCEAKRPLLLHAWAKVDHLRRPKPDITGKLRVQSESPACACASGFGAIHRAGDGSWRVRHGALHALGLRSNQQGRRMPRAAQRQQLPRDKWEGKLHQLRPDLQHAEHGDRPSLQHLASLIFFLYMSVLHMSFCHWCWCWCDILLIIIVFAAAAIVHSIRCNNLGLAIAANPSGPCLVCRK